MVAYFFFTGFFDSHLVEGLWMRRGTEPQPVRRGGSWEKEGEQNQTGQPGAEGAPETAKATLYQMMLVSKLSSCLLDLWLSRSALGLSGHWPLIGCLPRARQGLVSFHVTSLNPHDRPREEGKRAVKPMKVKDFFKGTRLLTREAGIGTHIRVMPQPVAPPWCCRWKRSRVETEVGLHESCSVSGAYSVRCRFLPIPPGLLRIKKMDDEVSVSRNIFKEIRERPRGT